MRRDLLAMLVLLDVQERLALQFNEPPLQLKTAIDLLIQSVQKRREIVSFATATPAKGSKQKTCKKGYSCGYTCISKTRNCRSPLTGQAANYATWLATQTGNAPAAAQQKLPADHVLSLNPRFRPNSLDQALDAIQTDGADQRVALFRQFVQRQQLQVIAWDINQPDAAQRSRVRAALKSHDFVQHFGADTQTAYQEFTEPSAGSAGYTGIAARHVFIETDSSVGRTKSFTVRPQQLQAIATQVLATQGTPFDDRFYTLSSVLAKTSSNRDAKNFVTYLHEIGHQVHYTMGRPPAPSGARALTQYSAKDGQEWFAEHFALYMLDAKAYRQANTIAADFFEQTLSDAATAPLRILPTPRRQ